MKSEKIIHEKYVRADGSIIEMKIWHVNRSAAYPDGVRYSLYWVQNKQVIVGYDNHSPKGPHRHIRGDELPYEYKDTTSLVRDFWQEVKEQMQ